MTMTLRARAARCVNTTLGGRRSWRQHKTARCGSSPCFPEDDKNRGEICAAPREKTAATGAARRSASLRYYCGCGQSGPAPWSARLVSRSFAREVPEVEALDVHPQA